MNALLKLGRDQVTASNDFENQQKETILALNNYIYTYYSTNKLDPTYSLEFAIQPDRLPTLLAQFKQKGFWYIAKNYRDDSYVEWIGKEKNETFLARLIVPDVGRYQWDVVEKTADGFLIQRKQSIFFLNDETTKSLEYNTSKNVFEQWTAIDLKNDIAIVVVEDPVVGRTTLYDEILLMLQ